MWCPIRFITTLGSRSSTPTSLLWRMSQKTIHLGFQTPVSDPPDFRGFGLICLGCPSGSLHESKFKSSDRLVTVRDKGGVCTHPQIYLLSLVLSGPLVYYILYTLCFTYLIKGLYFIYNLSYDTSQWIS